MVQLSIQVEKEKVEMMLQNLSKAIFDEMDTAIDNSLRKVKQTIDSDYRRTGNLWPSYLNPSPSGKGFTDRSGTLRGSITHWTEHRGSSVKGILSTGIYYDKYVELLWGGKYSFMVPALHENLQNIYNEVVYAVDRAVRFV